MAKRWPMMVGGLMIAGVAAGAIGALLSRRRQKSWNEYGSTGSTTSFRDDARSFADTARSTASSVTDTAKDKTNDVLGQMKAATETTTPSSTTASTPSPHGTGSGARPGEFSSGETYRSGTSTGASSRNGRS